MQLHTILAYALLFWHTQSPNDWMLFDDHTVLGTCLWMIAQPLLLGGAGWWITHRTQRLMEQGGNDSGAAQRFNHRATALARLALLTGFASSVLCTPWAKWFQFSDVHPLLQIVGDLLVLMPYFAGAIALWISAYPLERTLRAEAVDWLTQVSPPATPRWTLRHYLDFNIRHHLLVVAVPMTIILFAADLTRSYDRVLTKAFGFVWAPDVLLGITAAAVFVVAPVLLRHIWRTHPLEPGPLRDRLDALCRRINLTCRDILVWEADGFMINAAVMGIAGRVRYVLLSDALLAAMSERQIEAVFGHEAGHVRHRHIQKFLAFAFVGWVGVAAIMELLARLSLSSNGTASLSLDTIQGAGILATVAFWGIGFGMVSRRFERQADLFGARCVTPDPANCAGPCSVHGSNGSAVNDGDRVCGTGAALFASALSRVAALNGIPREERSWRHSSIASRMRFLASLAGDPLRATRFQRGLRRLSWSITALAIFGAVACTAYWIAVPEPAILALQSGSP